MTIVELFDRAARRYADRVAITDESGDTTFARLADRAERLAAVLIRSGLAVGDRVLDLQPGGARFLAADLACAMAGVVRVCLNPRLTEADWHRIADDCGARGLIVADRYRDVADTLMSGLPHVIVVDEHHDRRLDAAEPGARRVADLVSLNYTSGSTGAPKGVRRHHSHRLVSTDHMRRSVLGGGPGPDDVHLHAAPMTHTSGLFTLPFLAAGARQVVLDRFTVDGVTEAIDRHGVTHTALVPTMIARLLADGADVSALTMLAYAGAPLPAEQLRAAHTRLTPALVQYYGLVEAIPPVTVLDAADHARAVGDRPDLAGSAGRVVDGVRLRVIDTDGRDVPPGEPGEIITAGPHVTSGYWTPGADVKALRDGWFHTGDIGRVDGDGYLWIVDRLGDMIISGGYNIYPREIEDVVAAVPGVEQVAVYGTPDDEWGQVVTAAYTGTADEAAILAACADRLASFKKPRRLRRLAAMPLNANGKINKTELR